MPTNDERREVAARLRELAHKNSWMNGATLTRAIDVDIEGVGFVEADVITWNRLADLIEPEPQFADETQTAQHHLVSLEKITGDTWKPERTCEFTYELGDDGWWWYCSNCGVLPSEYDLDNVPNFCPNCGAKVVGE